MGIKVLNEDDVKLLRVGDAVRVKWSGGNGPHLYTVTQLSLSGTLRLATAQEMRLGMLGMNWLSGPFGTGLTEVERA